MKRLRTLKVEDEEWEKWQKAAGAEEKTVSEWIRQQCNGIQELTVKECQEALAQETKQKPAEYLPLKRKPVEVIKGKTCEHGTEKGYNCWVCGGLAKV